MALFEGIYPSFGRTHISGIPNTHMILLYLVGWNTQSIDITWCKRGPFGGYGFQHIAGPWIHCLIIIFFGVHRNSLWLHPIFLLVISPPYLYILFSHLVRWFSHKQKAIVRTLEPQESRGLRVPTIPIKAWLNAKNPLPGWWFGIFFIFHFIYGIILPIDELIFFKMVIAPPTRYSCSSPLPKCFASHLLLLSVAFPEFAHMNPLFCGKSSFLLISFPVSCWSDPGVLLAFRHLRMIWISFRQIQSD